LFCFSWFTPFRYAIIIADLEKEVILYFREPAKIGTMHNEKREKLPYGSSDYYEYKKNSTFCENAPQKMLFVIAVKSDQRIRTGSL